MKDRVLELLEECAEIRKERNPNYGGSYKTVGSIFKAIFPEGVELKTEDDFNRFCVFGAVIGKISRYSPNFSDCGHADSLKDIANYALMLAELDEEKENAKNS